MATFRFEAFPTLVTERLLLRSFSADDAADVLAFRGDPEVQKYNSAPMTSLEEARAFVDQRLAEFARSNEIGWGIADAKTNRVLGSCGLGPWSEWHGWASLGYDLRRDRWGQGIALEALRKVIAFGFGQMQLNRIEARTLVVNSRSARLLGRLGFRHEGTRRECLLEDDGIHYDSAIYGLLRGEQRS